MEVVWRTLKEFSCETSVSGINNSAKGNSRIRSTAWLAVFGLLAYATADGIYGIVVDYLKYPVITNTDLTHRSEVDFPAVTICNLNRVNCHNAFQAMFDIKTEINNSTLTTSELENLELILIKLTELISSNVTNCMFPICTSLKKNVGKFRNTTNTDPQLFMLLGSGCPLNEDEEIMYCNFLLEIKEDGEVEKEDQDKANELFAAQGCSISTACSYCHEEKGGKDSKGKDKDKNKEKTCLNAKPAVCDTLEATEGGEKGKNGKESQGKSKEKDSSASNTNIASDENVSDSGNEDTGNSSKNNDSEQNSNGKSSEVSGTNSKSSSGAVDSASSNSETTELQATTSNKDSKSEKTTQDSESKAEVNESDISNSSNAEKENANTEVDSQTTKATTTSSKSNSKTNEKSSGNKKGSKTKRDAYFPLIRIKRKGGGGGGHGHGKEGENKGPEEETKSVDFDSDARFVKRIMDIPPKYR